MRQIIHFRQYKQVSYKKILVFSNTNVKSDCKIPVLNSKWVVERKYYSKTCVSWKIETCQRRTFLIVLLESLPKNNLIRWKYLTLLKTEKIF